MDWICPKFPGVEEGSNKRGADERITGRRVVDRPKENDPGNNGVDGPMLGGVDGLNNWNLPGFGVESLKVCDVDGLNILNGDCCCIWDGLNCWGNLVGPNL